MQGPLISSVLPPAAFAEIISSARRTIFGHAFSLHLPLASCLHVTRAHPYAAPEHQTDCFVLSFRLSRESPERLAQSGTTKHSLNSAPPSLPPHSARRAFALQVRRNALLRAMAIFYDRPRLRSNNRQNGMLVSGSYMCIVRRYKLILDSFALMLCAWQWLGRCAFGSH